MSESEERLVVVLLSNTALSERNEVTLVRRRIEQVLGGKEVQGQ